MTVSSHDPNKTSGRAAANVDSLRYPLTENPTMKTRLKFFSYSRLNPNSLGKMELSAVITLPLPMNLPDSTGIATESFDAGLFGNIPVAQMAQTAQSAGSAGAFAQALLDQGQSLFSETIKGRNQNDATGNLLRDLHTLAVAPGINDTEAGKMAQRIVGVVRNPHTNSIFSGVRPRAFNLGWRFAPRSRQEADALTKIKDLIKMRILPEESMKGVALDYPDVVDIELVGDLAPHVGKYYRAFVTNFSATPTSGQWFEKGQPTEQEWNMELLELNPITRNTLRGEKKE